MKTYTTTGQTYFYFPGVYADKRVFKKVIENNIRFNLIIILLVFIALSGCTNSLITLPELPEQTCPDPLKTKPVASVEPKQCPSMIMPVPVPKNVHIDIKGGEIVEIDEGGEQLIRGYAATRKIIKKLWPDHD